MLIESIVTDIRPPNLLGMDFHSAWLYGHLAYTITPSAEGTTLQQHETVHLRGPYAGFAGESRAAFAGQLSKRLTELRELLEANT